MFRFKALKNSIRTTVVLSLLVGLMVSLAASAYADHLSNSRAELSGHGISGHAIVNYVRGTEGWSSTVTVHGLEAGEYTFAVNASGANQTTICTFTSDGNGSDGCSDQETAIPGFNTAVVLDAHGEVVASGMFERRDGQRTQP
jgi:hypothetical protein